MSDSDSNSEIIAGFGNIDSNLESLKSKINNPIELNIKHRQMVFIIISIEYCFSYCDGGIVPQQNFEDEGESRVGLFGSIDYVGRIIGALVMSLLIDRIDRQLFFSGCCILKALTLFVSSFTENY